MEEKSGNLQIHNEPATWGLVHVVAHATAEITPIEGEQMLYEITNVVTVDTDIKTDPTSGKVIADVQKNWVCVKNSNSQSVLCNVAG